MEKLVLIIDESNVGVRLDKFVKDNANDLSREYIQELGLQFQCLRTTNDMYFVFSGLAFAKCVVTVNEILVHQRVEVKSSLSRTREKSWKCFYLGLFHNLHIPYNDKINHHIQNYREFFRRFLPPKQRHPPGPTPAACIPIQF